MFNNFLKNEENIGNNSGGVDVRQLHPDETPDAKPRDASKIQYVD